MNLLTGTSRQDIRALVKQEMGMVGGGLTTLPDPERQEEKTARPFLPRVVVFPGSRIPSLVLSQ